MLVDHAEEIQKIPTCPGKGNVLQTSPITLLKTQESEFTSSGIAIALN